MRQYRSGHPFGAQSMAAAYSIHWFKWLSTRDGSMSMIRCILIAIFWKYLRHTIFCFCIIPSCKGLQWLIYSGIMGFNYKCFNPGYKQWLANPNVDLDLNPDLATFRFGFGCAFPSQPEVATDLPLIYYLIHTLLLRSAEECTTSYSVIQCTLLNTLGPLRKWNISALFLHFLSTWVWWLGWI